MELKFNELDLDYFLTGVEKRFYRTDGSIVSDPQNFFDEELEYLVIELILMKYLEYLAGFNINPIIIQLKKNNLLPVNILVKLQELKEYYNDDFEKLQQLNKYLTIKPRTIETLLKNKAAFTELQGDMTNLRNLQLIYLLYRLIDYFHLDKQFDFEQIKRFLMSRTKDYLDTIPLVTLKNPELYYCGIYLSIKLGLTIDHKSLKSFLEHVFQDLINSFEAPFVQGTRRLYYLIKTIELIGLSLPDEKISLLLQENNAFYSPTYLQGLETSRLILIPKLYNILGMRNKIDPTKISAIENEINHRIESDDRDLYSSEVLYYLIFHYYGAGSLKKLKNFDIVERLVSKIHRNLTIFILDEDISADIISELVYSFESLKLLNCISTKDSYSHLINYILPNQVASQLTQNFKQYSEISNCKELKINKITGDLIVT